MTRHSPYVITLSSAERAVLEKRSRSYSARHADVVRARIVLLGADGHPNTAIAERLDVHVNVVRTWRKRFVEAGLDGLADRARRARHRAAPRPAEAGAADPEPPGERGLPRPRGETTVPAGAVVVPVGEPDAGRGADRTRRRRPARRSPRPDATPAGQLIHLHPRHGSTAALDALRHLVSTIDRYLAEVDAEHGRNRAGAPAPTGG
jgi:hypothetical protein